MYWGLNSSYKSTVRDFWFGLAYTTSSSVFLWLALIDFVVITSGSHQRRRWITEAVTIGGVPWMAGEEGKRISFHHSIIIIFHFFKMYLRQDEGTRYQIHTICGQTMERWCLCFRIHSWYSLDRMVIVMNSPWCVSEWVSDRGTPTSTKPLVLVLIESSVRYKF